MGHGTAAAAGLMLGHSHALSGAVTGLAAGLFLQLSFPQTAALAGFTAGMALLPDLDKCGSSPARCLGFLSEPLASTTGTRPELLVVDPLLTAALVVLVGWAADPAFVAAHWRSVAG